MDLVPNSFVDLADKRVCLVIAHRNFRDEEFQEPYSLLSNKGAKVDVASTSLEEAVGMFGKRVKPNKLLKEVDPADYDAIIFVGGIGSTTYFEDEVALGLAREACKAGKIVAAICIAPVILANAGVLRGKEATVWDGEYVEKLKAGGATYVRKDVVSCERVVTASGPHAARRFAEEIARLLRS